METYAESRNERERETTCQERKYQERESIKREKERERGGDRGGDGNRNRNRDTATAIASFLFLFLLFLFFFLLHLFQSLLLELFSFSSALSSHASLSFSPSYLLSFSPPLLYSNSTSSLLTFTLLLTHYFAHPLLCLPFLFSAADKAEVPNDLIPTKDGQPARAPDQPRAQLVLTSASQLFTELRGMSWPAVGPFLARRSKSLRADVAEGRSVIDKRDLKQMKTLTSSKLSHIKVWESERER